MQPGIDSTDTRRTISFAALLIACLLFEIWMMWYREINFDFSNTPPILPMVQGAAVILALVSLFGLIWYGLLKGDKN